MWNVHIDYRLKAVKVTLKELHLAHYTRLHERDEMARKELEGIQEQLVLKPLDPHYVQS